MKSFMLKDHSQGASEQQYKCRERGPCREQRRTAKKLKKGSTMYGTSFSPFLNKAHIDKL